MAEFTDLQFGQGETFRVAATIISDDGVTVFNITNYNFSGQVRENYSTDEVAATLNITKFSPYTSGSILIELTPEQTMNLTQRKYVYDITMSSGSISPITRRILEGSFTVRPAVTR